MTKLRSYSSPFNFGHKALQELFLDPVIVQEKIDGSQISFGIGVDGLSARSRNQELFVSEDDTSMFNLGIATIVSLKDKLEPGFIYRGEYLRKPKQNTLVYDRVPDGNIILYDIDRGDQDYMNPAELFQEAQRLGLEVTPMLASFDKKPTVDELKELLKIKSVLGNVTVEGVVIKNYNRYGVDKKTLMGKYVSETFKEKHSKDWKKSNPTKNDVIFKLGEEYGTEARWQKSVQHLKENGTIEGVVQDIPLLLKEINQDVLEEYGKEIKERLFKHFWKQISRHITRGFPVWYKNYLMEEALSDE